MTVETRTVRRPSAAELQLAWRALTNGEYAPGGPHRPVTDQRWTPVAGETVVPLLGRPGSFGATTVAVALATVAAMIAEAGARVVECCPPSGSGLAAAADAELGVDSSGWIRGRRGQVLLDRCPASVTEPAAIPPPPTGVAGLTVVDVCWDPTVVLTGGGWLAHLLRGAPTVVAVCPSAAPAFRQLDVLADLLPSARLLVVSVGTSMQFWPAAVRRSVGPVAEAALADGRVVRVPIARRWAARGLTADPLPSWMLAPAARLRRLIPEPEGPLT
jgi:hypothetical protein